MKEGWWAKKKFLSEPANFSTSDQISEKTVQNGLEKRKNLYLIKLLSKWKMAIRKGHTSFLLFHFWDLKLVPIDSALNLLQVTCLIFFKNVGVVPRKAAKLENPVKIFLKCPLWSIAAKLENVGTKMFLQIYKILLNFDSNFLICDPTLFPDKNSPNIAKNNRIFPGNGKEDRILKYSLLRLKLEQKWKLWVRLFFMKTRILKFFSNNAFVC